MYICFIISANHVAVTQCIVSGTDAGQELKWSFTDKGNISEIVSLIEFSPTSLHSMVRGKKQTKIHHPIIND